jgi:hypothetical protein
MDASRIELLWVGCNESEAMVIQGLEAWSDPHPTLGLSFVSFFWMRLDLDVANMGKVMALMPTVDGGGDSEGDGEEDGEEDGEGSIRSLGAAIWRSSSEALRIEPCWRSVRTTRR